MFPDSRYFTRSSDVTASPNYILFKQADSRRHYDLQGTQCRVANVHEDQLFPALQPLIYFDRSTKDRRAKWYPTRSNALES